MSRSHALIGSQWDSRKTYYARGVGANYIVGGERLCCREVEGRDLKPQEGTTPFCFALADIRQVYHKQKKVRPEWSSFRPYDWNTLASFKDDVLRWVLEYREQRKPRITDSAEKDYPKTFESMGLPVLTPMEELEARSYARNAAQAVEQGGDEWKGTFQKVRWPRVTDKCMAGMRSTSFGEQLLNWPMTNTLTGQAKMDIGQILPIMSALGRGENENLAIFALRTFMPSDEATRAQFYRHLGVKAAAAQQKILEEWMPEKAVPDFDLQ